MHLAFVLYSAFVVSLTVLQNPDLKLFKHVFMISEKEVLSIDFIFSHFLISMFFCTIFSFMTN